MWNTAAHFVLLERSQLVGEGVCVCGGGAALSPHSPAAPTYLSLPRLELGLLSPQLGLAVLLWAPVSKKSLCLPSKWGTRKGSAG